MPKQVAAEKQSGLKPWMAYTILGVAILVAGLYVYRWWASGSQAPIAMMCTTDGCLYTTSIAPRVGDPSVIKCPKCGKDSVIAAIYCPQCGTATVWNESRGLRGPTKCKKCGLEMRYQ